MIATTTHPFEDRRMRLLLSAFRRICRIVGLSQQSRGNPPADRIPVNDDSEAPECWRSKLDRYPKPPPPFSF